MKTRDKIIAAVCQKIRGVMAEQRMVSCGLLAASDIARLAGIHSSTARKHLGAMRTEGEIVAIETPTGFVYMLPPEAA